MHGGAHASRGGGRGDMKVQFRLALLHDLELIEVRCEEITEKRID
jgi:hypothetical protein